MLDTVHSGWDELTVMALAEHPAQWRSGGHVHGQLESSMIGSVVGRYRLWENTEETVQNGKAGKAS